MLPDGHYWDIHIFTDRCIRWKAQTNVLKADMAELEGHWLSTELWVALFALAGTLTGSFTGILVANKLVNYRLEQLEKKVEKHNNLVERIAMAENDIKIINHRIDDIEKALE